MEQKLNPIERRVIGVLLEKSMTQPDYYPMTLNAIVTACNQKSNRHPVMELGEDLVWDTLESLRLRGLVGKVLASMSGRVDRFRHEVEKALGWEKPQRAIMAELLLRGTQTMGELRTRGSRMYAFESLETVSAVLESLASLEPPMIATLPRSPGQSAIRYTHLLYPEDEQPETGGVASAASTSISATSAPTPPPMQATTGASIEDHESIKQLREQVKELHVEMAELYDAVADLGKRLDAIEGR